MKRQILSITMAICLGAAANLAGANATEDMFDKGIVDSVTIAHPILEKVFPGVVFKEIISAYTLPPERRVMACFNGERMGMSGEFNKLYAEVSKASKAPMDERIEAFVRLTYWLWDPALKIIKQEKVKIEKEGALYSHRVILSLNYMMPGITQLELFIQIKNGQIARVEECQNGKRQGWIEPTLLGFTDNATLAISGDIVHETWTFHYILWEHYYVVVSENGNPTGNSITFTVSDLVAGRSSATVGDRIEAFARLHFWKVDPALQITSNESEQIEIQTKDGLRWEFTHLLGFVLRGSDEGELMGEMLLLFKHNQISRVYVRYSDGHGYIVPGPILINSTDDFGLELVGLYPQIFPNEILQHEHYYITTSENWSQLTSSIQLRATGLQQGERYIMVIRPFSWTDDPPSPFFTSDPLIADHNHAITTFWLGGLAFQGRVYSNLNNE